MKEGFSYSVILTAKFLSVIVSYHAMSWRMTASRNSFRMEVICLRAEKLARSMATQANIK